VRVEVITPIKLSPAWVGYNEPLDPNRHYAVRLFATSASNDDSARTEFLKQLSKYLGVEIPLAYKSAVLELPSRGITLPYAPSSSFVELPVGSNVAWLFFIQPVDAFVTPLQLNIVASVLDPRVTAVLVERASSMAVTEEQLEGIESAANREAIAKDVLRPYPYDQALIPDRGYIGVFHFKTAMPGEIELKQKLKDLDIEYIDVGDAYRQKMVGENWMTVVMVTGGRPPTPRQLAYAFGAQTVYIDRRMELSASFARTAGITGTLDDVFQRVINLGVTIPQAGIAFTEFAAVELPKVGLDILEAMKWLALVGAGIFAGGLLSRIWRSSQGAKA
jgi:hypothetical protein